MKKLLDNISKRFKEHRLNNNYKLKYRLRNKNIYLDIHDRFRMVNRAYKPPTKLTYREYVMLNNIIYTINYRLFIYTDKEFKDITNVKDYIIGAFDYEFHIKNGQKKSPTKRAKTNF